MNTISDLSQFPSGSTQHPALAAESDVVFVRDFKVQTLIGVYPQERRSLQTIRLDLDIGLPKKGRWTSDQIGDTVDYGAVVQRIRGALETCRFFLIETLAEHVAGLVLEEFDTAWVRVRVAKSAILPNVSEVGFCIRRERAAPAGASGPASGPGDAAPLPPAQRG